MMVRVESSEQVEMTTGGVVVLEVRSGSARAQARPDQPLVIGRERGCQLVVDDPLVSRRHAEVVFAEDGWLLRDLGSRNGTFVEGQRSAYVAVTDGGEVRLGNAEQGPIVRFAFVHRDPAEMTQDGADSSGALAVPAVSVRMPTAEHEAAERIRIGRGAGNDIALTDLKASRNHAEVRRTGEVHEVVDLGSRNGTFLNGRQVRRSVINPGDRVSVGRHEFVFDGQRLIEFEDTGPVSLSAERLTVLVGDQILLDDVSFALEAGSLLAVIGPSGCGKSTLLKAVTGLRPANRGRVGYDGRDLYAQYAELRYRIGMVPQDDVLHKQLTVQRALRFAAALRFADDVPRAERSAKVEEVLQTLGLAQRARQRIDTLSGGQRKRTSVALELLTEPSSGLDPALDKEVMEELRELADTGRTVIVVTHNVLHLDMCDRVLVLGIGGTLAYFGPPDEVLGFFKADDYAEVFSDVTDEPARWARAYRDSELYRRYIGDTLEELEAQRPLPAPRAAAEAATAAAPPAVRRAVGRARVGRPRLDPPLGGRARHPTAPLRQFATLCLRMLAVIGADRVAGVEARGVRGHQHDPGRDLRVPLVARPGRPQPGARARLPDRGDHSGGRFGRRHRHGVGPAGERPGPYAGTDHAGPCGGRDDPAGPLRWAVRAARRADPRHRLVGLPHPLGLRCRSVHCGPVEDGTDRRSPVEARRRGVVALDPAAPGPGRAAHRGRPAGAAPPGARPPEVLTVPLGGHPAAGPAG